VAIEPLKRRKNTDFADIFIRGLNHPALHPCHGEYEFLLRPLRPSSNIPNPSNFFQRFFNVLSPVSSSAVQIR
jgi:hypothetical protein